MQSFDVIAQFGVWLWFALAVALFVLDPSCRASIRMVRCLGGRRGSDCAPHAHRLAVAINSFALVALATVFWVRSKSREESSKSDVPDLNIRGAQYIGRIVTVEDAIKNGRGKVRVNDTVWSAEGEDAAPGSPVKVIGVDGTVLVVARTDAV